MSLLPKRLRKLVRTAEVAARGVSVIRKTGTLGAFRPRGIAQFARSVRDNGRPGPQQLVRLYAFNTPDKVAVVFRDERFTYGELDQRIARLAHALHGLGIGPGAAVAVMLRNCHQYLEAQCAVAHLGATIVQVGYRLKAGEVAYILENSQSKAFLYGSEFGEVAAAAAREANTIAPEAMIDVGARYQDLLERVGPVDGPPVVGTEGMSGLMVYTSGTTGKPKGALRDLRRTGLEPALDLMRQLPISHDDRHLVVCPLYHSAAPAFMLPVMTLGGTVVILEHFDPEEVLRVIEFERITSSMMVPTMYARIVNLPSQTLRKYDTSSLKWLMSGAAPLPTQLAGRIEEVLGPILYNFYGATETGYVTLALPGEHTARPGTIGRALAGTEIRLLDEAGHDVPAGEVGELWVRSSMLVDGYYRNQEATEKSRREGFFTVGDLARRDADGYYYLADRKIDMVISGGVNIYPLEIEQHLLKHPAVLDCAVIGVPDAEWGESLCAFVVLRPRASATADELRAWVKGELADYKKPKHVLFTDVLPRTPTGKVLKRELREQAAKTIVCG
ncbi:MAG TPA: AMP-binding protein [Polyangia bacterium]|nr:AMP-binding protein [Polyangia bacterium]